MQGTIVNFKSSRHRQTGNQAVIKIVDLVSREDAEKLVGKKVSYACEGKDKKVIAGEIRSAHGNSGAVRALFEKGLPGQAVGAKVSIQ